MKPDKLSQFTKNFTKEGPEELLALGVLVAATAYFPNTVLRYNGSEESLSYCAFWLSPPASGKRILKNTHPILSPLKKEIGENNIYMSANSTDAMFFERLQSANGKPLVMLDSEVSIFLSAGKSEHSRMSRANLIKTLSFEQLSIERKGAKKSERLQYYISEPRLSAVFTGTPAIFDALNLSNGDGFLSRIHLINTSKKAEWHSPRPESGIRDTQKLGEELGAHLLKAHQFLKDKERFEIMFTNAQWDKIDFLGKNPESYGFDVTNDAIHESIMRAGVRICKLAAICTLIEKAGSLTGDHIMVDDCEFNYAFNLVINDLLKIAPRLISIKKQPDTYNNSDLTGLEILKRFGKEFATRDFYSAMNDAGLSDSTAKRVLQSLKQQSYIEKCGHGKYLTTVQLTPNNQEA